MGTPSQPAARPPNTHSDAVEKCRAAAEALRDIFAVDHLAGTNILRSLKEQIHLLEYGGFSTAPIDAVTYPYTKEI